MIKLELYAQLLYGWKTSAQCRRWSNGHPECRARLTVSTQARGPSGRGEHPPNPTTGKIGLYKDDLIAAGTTASTPAGAIAATRAVILLSFIHPQCSSLNLLAIQGLHRTGGVGI